MQTFLPYPLFYDSAKVLDRRRLGKQRVEAWQILQALTDSTKTGWVNHPAVQQWKGHEWWLAQYGRLMCLEWISRGYQDTMLERFEKSLPDFKKTSMPSWIGCWKYHTSHQANLVRKDPLHYRPFFPDVDETLPYFWPARSKS